MKSHERKSKKQTYNTSYWFFLYSHYGYSVRRAKRTAARDERMKQIQVKRMLGWHRCHEYNAGLITFEWEIVE